ncbi:hypothetical protein SAZ_40565 [Streptomyces noursei ZPM]|uniref:Uncharacterized protein n=1 Tax=Streptomyces noursei TaxID=1971 RepID=A0A401QQY1_STRNR|nr:hypothetical protein SAZ_40565 [Streptomyces noursei ZPM]EOS99240.1 hypothetical protein K530_34933 [Streptomyces noursei CCRC 11814]GCB87703.1 hypothetical protein SALB_00372 [Streptomyces noursei]
MNRPSAAPAYASARGFMAAPGSRLPGSTTFNSGCRSAISAADWMPVSPLPDLPDRRAAVRCKETVNASPWPTRGRVKKVLASGAFWPRGGRFTHA